MFREGRNNLLVDLIIIFSLTINCVIFMFDDVPFNISVTYGDVFECSSPYNFTIHSEHATTVLISMTVWMSLNQLIIALFYQYYDNFILAMCSVDPTLDMLFLFIVL